MGGAKRLNIFTRILIDPTGETANISTVRPFEWGASKAVNQSLNMSKRRGFFGARYVGVSDDD